MTKLNDLNNDFFSLFVLALIAVANIVSAVIHGKNGDWASVVFNVTIAGFSIVVLVHLIRNN